MSYEDRRTLRRQLETELQSPALQQKLIRLCSEFPATAGIASWEDYFARIHHPASSTTEQDRLLRPLIWSAQQSRDAGWNVVLTLAFWPTLQTLESRFRRWETQGDGEEFWSVLHWCFLEVAHGFDVVISLSGIGARIFNQCRDALRTHYRREWGQRRREPVHSPEFYENHAVDAFGHRGLSTEVGIDADLVWNEIERLGEAGILADDEMRLLRSVFVDGLSLVEYATLHQLPAESVKKRYQRLWPKIRRHLKIFQNLQTACPQARGLLPSTPSEGRTE